MRGRGGEGRGGVGELGEGAMWLTTLLSVRIERLVELLKMLQIFVFLSGKFTC